MCLTLVTVAPLFVDIIILGGGAPHPVVVNGGASIIGVSLVDERECAKSSLCVPSLC